jgi:DnaJ homolog subfamily C member 28
MDAELDDAIAKFDRIADRRIQDAINAGEFDNLAGIGKPLKVEDNPFVPRDLRAAYTVLSNSGYSPDWMVLAQQIDVAIEQLRANADRHFAFLRQRLTEISTDPYAVKYLRKEVARLKDEHRKAAARHSKAIDEINRNILTFNNTVPIASLLRVPLAHEQEMEKFEDRVPAYLSYVQ